MTEYTSEKSFLADYNIHDFDVPLATVDMAIFTVRDEQLEVLLVKRAQYPSKGKWALPGGFIDLGADKSLDDTARRKLKIKTGVDTPYLEQVQTVGSNKRDPRGWSMTVVYFALIASDSIVLEQDESSEEIEWVPIAQAMDEIKLAFDHKLLLELSYERLKNKVAYTSLPVNLLPDLFTLTELQKVFELILGEKVEKKSFRRRVLDADILEETEEMRTGSNRPARLYRVKASGLHHVFPRSLEGSR